MTCLNLNARLLTANSILDLNEPLDFHSYSLFAVKAI